VWARRAFTEWHCGTTPRVQRGTLDSVLRCATRAECWLATASLLLHGHIFECPLLHPQWQLVCPPDPRFSKARVDMTTLERHPTIGCK
jgi:hypothetical protein